MKVVELGSICEFENGDRGKNYPSRSDQVEEGVPFINAGCLKDWGIDSDELNFITEERYNLLSSGKLKQNDILFCLRGSLGKFAINSDGLKGAIASSLVLLRPKKDLNVHYLKNYLKSEQFRRLIERADDSSSQPNLSATRVKKFPIPLPSLSEQKAIVAKLDRAQRLIDIDKEMLAKYDDLIQSVFLEMFGDPVSNPKGWDIHELNELCKKITDGEHGSVNRVETGKMYLMARNVGHFGLNFEEVSYIEKSDHERIYKRCNPESGDLLLVCVGATIGRCCLVPDDVEEFSLARSVALIKPTDSLRHIYLLHHFKNSGFQNKMMSKRNTSAQSGLYLRQIRSLKFILPPIELQERFVERALKIDSEKLMIENSLKKSEELFSSLVQGAFN